MNLGPQTMCVSVFQAPAIVIEMAKPITRSRFTQVTCGKSSCSVLYSVRLKEGSVWR